MKTVTQDDLKGLYIPPVDSHKGQNGRMLLIGGSHLFHAASLWALTTASRIVDLVHYCSISENNDIVQKAKEEFRNGIVVPRQDLENYIEEDESILIGPGMVRAENIMTNDQLPTTNLEEINKISDEGVQTGALTNYLLKKYPEKQWVIDAGALQMVDLSFLTDKAILTPHNGEFEGLWKKCQMLNAKCQIDGLSLEEKIKLFAQQYNCLVLVKGPKDIAVNGATGEVRIIEGGNAGMTKGGTGDVLAGLIAALATKNDPWLAMIAGSYINKLAGDELYKTVGPYFNASDLAGEIPRTMKGILKV